jgi:hypothetical protein
VRLHLHVDVREHRCGLHWLVEPEVEENRPVIPAINPLVLERECGDCGSREAKRVRRRELAAAHRARGSIDRHVVAGCVRKGLCAIGREDQDRRAGPPECSSDRRGDPGEGRLDRLRDPAENNHRFREDDTDLVGLVECGDLTSRPGAQHRQRRGCLSAGAVVRE